MRRRKSVQYACLFLLALLTLAGLSADLLAPWPYDLQFRDGFNAPPSARFPLGTDELGRDRWSRLLHATKVSILLAPAAALLSVATAAVLGGLAGWRGGPADGVVLTAADLTLTVPWIFLMMTVRALLPLTAPPAVSLLLTFAVLGLLGWAGPARVVRQAAREALGAPYTLSARSRGVAPIPLFCNHVAPNLRPVLVAQFWTSVPTFILAEANLGMIGLGVAEPLPSWGSLLQDLTRQAAQGALQTSWWLLAPAFLVVLAVVLMRALVPAEVAS